ncbi:MAG TPA: zf-HC2 domain-containing protein [Hyalangium sp.]|nr:zf-HC2 domain-containing protein [Hyalangium sp.]
MLDTNERTQAWWFSARADCDDLVATWTQQPRSLTPHLQSCAECRADLAETAVVDQPPRRHLSSDDLWRFDMGMMSPDERARMDAHTAQCSDCAQAVLALEEGDDAIDEALEMDAESAGSPAARTSRAPVSRRPSARHPEQREVLEERRDFRVLLVRERQRVRLLVQPLSGRTVTAAVFLSPGKPSLKPTQGPEGISFELGADGGGARSAHLTVNAGGETLERDFTY